MHHYITPSPGYFASVWLKLAEDISDRPMPEKLTVLDAGVIPYVKLLYEHDDSAEPFLNVSQPEMSLLTGTPRWKLKKDKRCLLGYSGGKDSVAMALKLKKRGFKVTAIHVRHLNRSALDEEQASVDTCKMLGIPLVVIPFKTSGKSTRTENPAKNLIVLAFMVDHGGPKGISHYALGTDVNRNNGIDEYLTDLNFSDSPEVLYAGAYCYTRYFPNFKLYCGEMGYFPFDAYDSFKTVLGAKFHHLQSGNPSALKLLAASRSCMSQFRFRNRLKNLNQKKHGVELLPGRCGSCFKCCNEFLYLEAMGVLPLNPSYRRHCFTTMRKSMYSDWIGNFKRRLRKIRNKQAAGQ